MHRKISNAKTGVLAEFITGMFGRGEIWPFLAKGRVWEMSDIVFFVFIVATLLWLGRVLRFFNLIQPLVRFVPALVLVFGIAMPQVVFAEMEVNTEAVPLLSDSDSDAKAVKAVKRLRYQLKRTGTELKEATKGLAETREEVEKVRKEAVEANNRRSEALEEANRLAAKQLEEMGRLTAAQTLAANNTADQTAALTAATQREAEQMKISKTRELQIWFLIAAILILAGVFAWSRRSSVAPSSADEATVEILRELKGAHERLIQLSITQHGATMEKAGENTQALIAAAQTRTAGMAEAIGASQAAQTEQLSAAISNETSELRASLGEMHTANQLVQTQILRGVTGSGPRRLPPISEEGEHYLGDPIESLRVEMAPLQGNMADSPLSPLSGEINEPDHDSDSGLDSEQTGIWRLDEVQEPEAPVEEETPPEAAVKNGAPLRDFMGAPNVTTPEPTAGGEDEMPAPTGDSGESEAQSDPYTFRAPPIPPRSGSGGEERYETGQWPLRLVDEASP